MPPILTSDLVQACAVEGTFRDDLGCQAVGPHTHVQTFHSLRVPLAISGVFGELVGDAGHISLRLRPPVTTLRSEHRLQEGVVSHILTTNSTPEPEVHDAFCGFRPPVLVPSVVDVSLAWRQRGKRGDDGLMVLVVVGLNAGGKSHRHRSLQLPVVLRVRLRHVVVQALCGQLCDLHFQQRTGGVDTSVLKLTLRQLAQSWESRLDIRASC